VPDSTVPDSTVPDSTVPDPTVPDSTVRDPAAPDAPRQPQAVADAGATADVAATADAGPSAYTDPSAAAVFAGDLALHKITDARAMRALAHPVRIALLEALAHAGTLTATQASELLGESPANCAFHLRTLGKYGYVVEAGGGKGRERPWRRAHTVLQITSEQDDPLVATAAEEVGDYWLDMSLNRARSALRGRGSWPASWRRNILLGESDQLVYVTRQEANDLGAEIYRLYRRYDDRVDHPERRPDGAMAIQVVNLAYPMLHLTDWPGPGEHGPSEHGPGEHGPGEHGPGEHGPSDPGPGNPGPGEHDPSEHHPE
jgi:DNA-binding transcriptional ArsR family regulator